VLAASLGKGPAVSDWTSKAMNGGVKFEDALKARLDIIRPSRKDIERCLEEHPFEFTKGMPELVGALQEKGVDVWLVSGGFRLMIEPIAASLNIPPSNILANTILFDSSGSYAGFDPSEPTSRDGGKPAALAQIAESRGQAKTVMFGDGATDAQAKPPADAFVGYGGVQERESVRGKADWYFWGIGQWTLSLALIIIFMAIYYIFTVHIAPAAPRKGSTASCKKGGQVCQPLG